MVYHIRRSFHSLKGQNEVIEFIGGNIFSYRQVYEENQLIKLGVGECQSIRTLTPSTINKTNKQIIVIIIGPLI